MSSALTKEMIDSCFQGQNHQADVWSNLYRIAFPQWDSIKFIDAGWPRVSDKTGRYIAQKFITFDHKHHEGVLAGGLWMNKGFGTGDNVADWYVDTSECKLEMKKCK